jgi:acyl-CoA synthetase (AMP-forming)/AMP-acid ligase II
MWATFGTAAKQPDDTGNLEIDWEKPGKTLSEEEVNLFCHELPRYKRPRRLIFAPVPRNATGKIEKPRLRQIYGAEDIVAAQNLS